MSALLNLVPGGGTVPGFRSKSAGSRSRLVSMLLQEPIKLAVLRHRASCTGDLNEVGDQRATTAQAP